MGFFFSKRLKILGLVLAILGVEAYFIVSVPITSAFHNPPNSGGCDNVVLVTTSENPSCDAPSEVNPDMTSYSATYHIQALTTNTYTLKWNKQSWYCTDPFPHDGNDKSRLACRQSPVTAAGNVQLPASSAVDITIPGHFDQKACGSLQTDLSFDVVDNNNKVVCSYGNPDFVYGFSFCSTGKECGKPSPSPTTKPSPTSKPSPSPTAKPSPTPTGKPSPTAKPSPTPTGQPSGAPTETPTPTSAPGATATPAPTSQPPTSTPGQNIVVNVSQSQSQSQSQTQPQQQVLGATVAPPPTTSQLPSTGAGTDILFALGSLLPIGWKIRKMK